MNPHEQRVREFAYQIWESEGRPAGHEYRHWEMACKLAELYKDGIPEHTNLLENLFPLSGTPHEPQKSAHVTSLKENKKIQSEDKKNIKMRKAGTSRKEKKI